jgi:hypothetical protein
MNVHFTIDLYRHTSCERQIARRKSGTRPPHVFGRPATVVGREAFRENGWGVAFGGHTPCL